MNPVPSAIAIAVRPIDPFDLGAVAAMHAGCFADAWDTAALAALLAMPGAFGLLATEATAPVGFLLARVAGGEGELLTIGVTTDRRRRGIARLLLRTALERAAVNGAGRLFLEVAEDNLAAKALYLDHGFSEVGRRPAYYRHPARGGAALVLVRQLAPPDKRSLEQD